MLVKGGPGDSISPKICTQNFFGWGLFCCGYVNSLAPGRTRCHFKTVIFNLVSLIGIFTSFKYNALRWMPRDLPDYNSTLVQVTARCCQANVDLVLRRHMASPGHELTLYSPYYSECLHWHWGNHMIAPVPVMEPWRIQVKFISMEPQHSIAYSGVPNNSPCLLIYFDFFAGLLTLYLDLLT